MMILRRPSRPDPRLVLGSVLAITLPLASELGLDTAALAQSPPKAAPASPPPAAAPANTTAPVPPAASAPAAAPPTAAAPGTTPATGADALKQHDQELEAALNRQRQSIEAQAKLKSEIQALSQDRRKFNQQLIDTAAKVREVEANIEATRARLEPLDAQEKIFQKSLDERRNVIVEVLAALQRIGRQPPPALLVRPEDALQAVRTAITLGALVPEMRAEADALAGDLADLLRVRKDIVAETDRLAQDRDALARTQLRMSMLIDQRQSMEADKQQALAAEQQQAAALARQVDSIKDLIGKLEASLTPDVRAARESDRTVSGDATRPGLAALGDPGRLSPAIAFVNMRGRLHLPVNGTRIREFGGADGSGGTQKGLSIVARPGAQITAPCDGWVVYAGPFRSYGQLLILNAGGGYHVLLAGMERISVDLGQFVLTGEPVAAMGNGPQITAAVATGLKQPILYVEFRKDGAPIDPSPWWATNEGEKVRG
jgi:septal ring factor EnvC (AmiA/AmiB activator)